MYQNGLLWMQDRIMSYVIDGKREHQWIGTISVVFVRVTFHIESIHSSKVISVCNKNPSILLEFDYQLQSVMSP